MKTKTHNNFVRDRNDFNRRIVLIGLQNCKACKHRCRTCHWPYSGASTAIDEVNFCSSYCEDQYFKSMQK